MEKFIPYEKLSKKKKRELDAGKRTVWAISPVTRKSENPKAYNRKKTQKWTKDSSFCAFFPIHQLHFLAFLMSPQVFALTASAAAIAGKPHPAIPTL